LFYRPGLDPQALAPQTLNSIVTPRPIGWIATRGGDGRDNLAPYSFFNAVAYEPPQVMFASTGTKPDRGDTKDSVANIRETGVFCVNIVGWELREAMNLSSGAWPRETDEFTLAGLERADCALIPCARVAAAPAALECRLTRLVTLPGAANVAAFGEVIGIHLRDDCVKDGRFDTLAAHPLARLGGRLYTSVTEAFAMDRPGAG
jgi:flavin reductase (DIM6/NTAB) family NADH-FMN oxidoreductase RutF